ncbi:hypothetical protein, partial [Bacillus pumilus]|uniref:hypothetical protein n=1 Tax=Bacillus pumilus TaxID=1408 RepID=UPI001C92E517
MSELKGEGDEVDGVIIGGGINVKERGDEFGDEVKNVGRRVGMEVNEKVDGGVVMEEMMWS